MTYSYKLILPSVLLGLLLSALFAPLSANARTTKFTNVIGHVCLGDSDCGSLRDLTCEPLGPGYRLNLKSQDQQTGVPASLGSDFNYRKICKLKNNVEGCVISTVEQTFVQKNGVATIKQYPGGLPPDHFCAGSGSLICDVSKGSNGTCMQDFGATDVKDLGLGEETSDIRSKVIRVINLALSFLAVLGVVVIIYSGAVWASSLGNEEKVTKARNTLIAAAIGLVIITIAWTITSYVINLGEQIS